MSGLLNSDSKIDADVLEMSFTDNSVLEESAEIIFSPIL